MSLTVREFVTRTHLRLELLVAGDLDRTIRWVHSTEMPDAAPYLRGDEVVLTAGIWYWHGVAASSFVAGVGRANVAALGLGTNPLVKEVPAELVEACEAWALTLFRVPDDVSFIEITEEFVEAQHRLRERPLLDSLDRSSRFLDALQLGRGLDGLLPLVARLLDRRVALIRHGRGTVARGAHWEPPVDLVERSEAMIGSEDPVRDLDEFVAFAIPISASDAALVIDGALSELTLRERATIDQALTFIAIELQRARAVSESERRFAGELFDLVDAGETQYPGLAARLRTFALDPESPLVSIRIDAPDLEAALQTVREHFASAGRAGAFALRAGQLLGVFAAESDDDLATIGRELHRVLPPSALVGVGGVARDAHGLRKSMIESRHACRFAERRGIGYATHGAIASHALLLALQDETTLEIFQETLIRPLEQHDARRHTDLVATLDSFLSSGGRYQPTADALHLHVNTLRLRLARIEQITGRDLGSMPDRVDLWIALRTRSPTAF